MKVAMNSQCLRVVDGDKIIDYHITDGRTSSYVMDYMNNIKPDLEKYESKTISEESDIMSWGTDNDKMTDMNFVDVGPTQKLNAMATGSRTSKRNIPYSIPTQSYSPRPVVVVAPPKDFTETDNNAKGFGSLFGN